MRDFLKKSVDFRGRADVGEYCRWTFGCLVVAPVALRFWAVGLYGVGGVESNLPFQIWDAIVDFVLPIPASAVAFRRLHARGISARYFFVPFGIVYAASFFPLTDVCDDRLGAVFAGLALLIFVLCILPDDSEASPYSSEQRGTFAKVAKDGLEYCPKCGAFAPPRNEYCLRCGAAFKVEREPIGRWSSFSAFRFCLAEKYADFRGRASRREFWSWTAAVVWIELLFAVSATVAAVDGLIGAPFWSVWIGANLALTPPTLAVLTRRLRDRNAARFGFVLTVLTGIVAAIWLVAVGLLAASETKPPILAAVAEYSPFVLAAVGCWLAVECASPSKPKKRRD